MHGEVQQDPQEGSATVVIQVERSVLLTACTQRVSSDQFQFSLEMLLSVKITE